MSASVTPGRSGYLVARSQIDGSRYFGLFVRNQNRGVNFYYLYDDGTGNMVQGVSIFSTGALSDGESHDIELTVDGVFVMLYIDSVMVGYRRLAGLVVDCGEHGDNCLTHVGQREGGFPLTGCVSSATLQPLTEVSALDLLDDANHDGAVLPIPSLGVYCFDGSTGLQVSSFPVGSEEFRVKIEFSAAQGSSGYFVAKGAGGTSRYYSVFLSSSGQIRLYYRTVGSTSQRMALLSNSKSDVADSGRYIAVITIIRNVASYMLTDTSDGSTADSNSVTLAGAVDDCGMPGQDCTLHVGQRVGGFVLNRACLYNVTLYPRN